MTLVDWDGFGLLPELLGPHPAMRPVPIASASTSRRTIPLFNSFLSEEIAAGAMGGRSSLTPEHTGGSDYPALGVQSLNPED